jgi:hypothetical protein
VTIPDRAYMGRGNICTFCQGPMAPSPQNGRPRAYCSDNCRQKMSRLRRRAGEECQHEKLRTGKYTVGAAGIWFTPSATQKAVLCPYSDFDRIGFLVSRQPRPNRQTARSKAFSLDHATARYSADYVKGYDNPDKDERTAHMALMDSKVRRYGKRTKAGRFFLRKDWSSAINYEIAANIFLAARSHKEEV